MATRIDRFVGLPRRRKIAVVEALVAVIVVECLVRVLPFGYVLWIVERAGPRGDRAGSDDPGPTGRESGSIDAVRWAVPTAARRLPWSVTCLVRALVAHAMLGRRGQPAELLIGVSHDPGTGPRDATDATPVDARPASDPGRTLAAHSWVEVGDQVVVGDRADLGRYERFPPLS